MPLFFRLDEIFNQVVFWGTPVAIVLAAYAAIATVRRQHLLLRIPVIFVSTLASTLTVAFIQLLIPLKHAA